MTPSYLKFFNWLSINGHTSVIPHLHHILLKAQKFQLLWVSRVIIPPQGLQAFYKSSNLLTLIESSS